MKIISIDGFMGEVTAGGAVFRIDLRMINDPGVGDYVLMHAGFAIQKMCGEDASETLKLLRELDDSLL